MKKTLLIIIISLLGFSSITEAQIIVNSTQASTIRQKSSRKKGLVLRPEIGAGYVFYDPYGLYSNLNCNIGYQFNPYITIGVGGGIDYIKNSLAIPFYFDLKGYFSNRVSSPYYNIKLGYSANLTHPNTQVEYSYSDYLSSDYILGGGTYFDIGLGINYKSFDFGIGMSLIYGECVYPYSYTYNDNVIYDIKYNKYHVYYRAIKLTFGYNFQLNTKKK